MQIQAAYCSELVSSPDPLYDAIGGWGGRGRGYEDDGRGSGKSSAPSTAEGIAGIYQKYAKWKV